MNRNKVLKAARKQVRKGNWSKALTKFEQLVDDDASDARSMLKVADLHAKLDQTDQALDAYQSVARHYAGDDIYEKAVAVYKQAIRLASDRPDLHREVGDAYHSLGRLKDAVRAYHRAQKLYKRHANSAAQRDLLERMIELDPDDVGLRIQLAERYTKDDMDGRAVEMFEFAADKLDEEGRLDEFVQVAERILFLRDHAPDLRRRVIDIYLRRGDNKRALKHLQVCFKSNPRDVEILERLTEAFRRLERHDKAVLVMHELANLYRQQSREDAAIRTYEDIVELAPQDGRARKYLRKLRRLADSGVMTGHPDTDSLDPKPNQTPAEPKRLEEVDALEGVELLDEDSDSPVPETQVQPGHVPPPEERGLVDISDDIELIEGQADPGGGGPEDNSLAGQLRETEVFIKYGLYDKAYEAIVGVIAKHPDNLDAHEQMKRLQVARGRTDGAVDELLEMARITQNTPARAEAYVSEALEVTTDVDRVYQAAASLNIAVSAGPDTQELPEIEVLDDDQAAFDGPGGSPEDDEADTDTLEADEGPDPQTAAIDESGAADAAEIELDDADLEELMIADDDSEMMAVADDDLDFDESAFDGADVVDMDVDIDELDELGELSDAQMVAVADDDDSPDLGVSFTEDEADEMFADLFDHGGSESAATDLGDLGDDDSLGELAEVDFFLQQDLVEEAQQTLDTIRADHPDHPGIDRRAEQIERARQTEPADADDSPFGARSLSKKFSPGAEAHTSGVHHVGAPEAQNSSIELGSAYRDMGLYQEAIDEFEHALDDPQAADAAHFHIAVCELQNGDPTAARRRLETLVNQRELADGIRRAARQKLEEIGVS